MPRSPSTANGSQETQVELTGVEALRQACDRNVPVEVFRCADAGTSPPARGRLLSMDDEELLIEKLQIIGSSYELTMETPLEGYFRLSGQLFRFDTKVRESRIAARLNGRLVVPALKVRRPERVVPGQRRNVYRVSLSGRTDAPKVEVWLSDPTMTPDADTDCVTSGPAAVRTRPPDFVGRAVDASDTGIGAVLHQCIYSRLKLLQQVWMIVHVPDDEAPMQLRASVRHSTPVLETDARVGLHFCDDGSSGFARHIRRLTAYLTRVQREQRR